MGAPSKDGPGPVSAITRCNNKKGAPTEADTPYRDVSRYGNPSVALRGEILVNLLPGLVLGDAVTLLNSANKKLTAALDGH